VSEVLELTKELIKRESITPLDEGCQDLVATRLKKLGFVIKHLPFGEVSNLWATYGKGEKTLTLLGLTINPLCYFCGNDHLGLLPKPLLIKAP